MRPALMIIDLQKAYYNDKKRASMKKACIYINEAIPIFRNRKLPIIWVQNLDEEDHSIPGMEGFDFMDELKPEIHDYRIQKRYRNTFHKTNCEEIIKNEKIDTVIITGYCAEYCVQGTCVGALDRDILPVILRNGIASGSQEHLQMIENINEIISLKALKKVLENI